MLVSEAKTRVRSYLHEKTAGLYLDSEIYNWINDGQMEYLLEEKITNTDILTDTTKIPLPSYVIDILSLKINTHFYTKHIPRYTNLHTYGYSVHDNYIVLDYSVSSIAVGDLIINIRKSPDVIKLTGENLTTTDEVLQIPEKFCKGIIFYAVAQAYLMGQEIVASREYMAKFLRAKEKYDEHLLNADAELVEDSFDVYKLVDSDV